MAIAYSQNTVVYTTGIRADTSANFRADMDVVLLAAGWVHSTATVTNGIIYDITSPQGLGARCVVFDTNTNTSTAPSTVSFQFQGTTGTNTGYIHAIAIETTSSYIQGYQAVAGICQLFFSLPGIGFFNPDVGGHPPNSFAGGIPFIPDQVGAECVAQINNPLPTEIWWTCGAQSNRTDLRVQNYCILDYSYSLNGVATSGTSGGGDNDSFALRVYPIIQTNRDGAGITLMIPVQYDNLTQAYRLDPFIGWGGRIQGQIWDSYIETKTNTLEAIETFDEGVGTSTWINYASGPTGWQSNGNGCEAHSLFLMNGFVASGTGISNYAY
jgi:hypothetical protein